MKMIKKILVGIIAGFISGLFAAGGGMIVVPAFVHKQRQEQPLFLQFYLWL